MRVEEILEWSLTANTALHRVDPATKLGCLSATLLALLLVRDPWGALLLSLPYLIGALAVRAPWGSMARLSVVPLGFLGAILALMLPTGVPAREVALYAARGFTALLATLLVAFTTPFNALWSSIASLMPGRLAEMALLFHRSLYGMIDDLNGLLRAARMRGARPGPRLIGVLVATLLARSHESARRLMASLEVRGARGRVRPLRRPRPSREDAAWTLLTLLSIALALLRGV